MTQADEDYEVLKAAGDLVGVLAWSHLPGPTHIEWLRRGEAMRMHFLKRYPMRGVVIPKPYDESKTTAT